MNKVRELTKTMTTAQALKKLRKEHSDADILLIAHECSRGVYEAVSSIINKEVSSNRYSSEERKLKKEWSQDMTKAEREEFEDIYKVEPNVGMMDDMMSALGFERNKDGSSKQVDGVRSHNIGASDYATKKIQPWDIWLEYNLNPWDADIIKRVLRTKEGESRQLEYEKIIHICEERLRQLTE